MLRWNPTLHSTILTFPNVLFFFRFPTIYFSPAGQKQSPKRYEVCSLSEYNVKFPGSVDSYGRYGKLIRLDFIHFQGGREVSDFISYLKKEASNPLVVKEDEEKKKSKKKKSEL